uniref:Hypothetical 1.5K protein n=1 Tax=Solanum tuberosum TaxID=4113 RepID=Q7M2E6_SOLTU
MKNYEEEFTWI